MTSIAARKPGKPRLLFLCQTLPYPPDGGAEIRSYHVLRLLSRSFDITALCFYRRATKTGNEGVAAAVEALAAIAHVEVFPIPHEHSRLRTYWDHFRSVATRRAYTVYSYASTAFRRRIHELVRDVGFDVVHVDSLDLSDYLPDVSTLPVVCAHHNIESDLLLRRAAQIRPIWKAAYMRFQAGLIRSEEITWIQRVALNIVVSERDRQELLALAPGSAVETIPNGVDTDFFAPGNSHERLYGLVFSGSYSWFPNRDALEYFCAEIMPLISARHPDLRVTWIGRVPTAVSERYAATCGITFTGYVDDIRPLLDQAACYVVPIRVGGGTRLKILDAWAMGKAIVSTSIGCEGLNARDGGNILVRDTPQDFADAVADIINNDALRLKLSSAARATAETEYEWELIGDKMLDAYHSLMRATAST